MKCPYCGNESDKVLDTRPLKEGKEVRRRRECTKCGKRFTTYEYIQALELYVIKNDKRREPFDRRKLAKGIMLACRKRPIPVEKIEQLVDEVEEGIMAKQKNEVKSSYIGKKIMDYLKDLDEIAYVRFASVYKKFKDVSEFMETLEEINSGQGDKDGNKT